MNRNKLRLKENKTSVIILSAGNSSRMQKSKFALKLPNGKLFIQNIVEQYIDFGCSEIVLILNNSNIEEFRNYDFDFIDRIKIVVNNYPERERFYSLQCGLKSIKSNNPIFIHNVDNPFALPETLEKLYSNLGNFDFAKPVYKGKGGHPILISKKVWQEIITDKNFNQNLKTFLLNFNCKLINIENNKILLNINTKEKYKELLQSVK